MANIKPFTGMGLPGPGGHLGLDFLRGLFGDAAAGSFNVDVRDEGDRYEIDADLPGLHREMINVEAHGGYLTISANMDSDRHEEQDDFIIHERRQGTVSRSFAIGDVDEDKITAKYENGVLKVVLPKGGDEDDSKRKISID